MTRPTWTSIRKELAHTRAELWLLDRLLARSLRQRILTNAAGAAVVVSYGLLMLYYHCEWSDAVGWATGAASALSFILYCWLSRDVGGFIKRATAAGLQPHRCRFLGEGSHTVDYRAVHHERLMALHLLRWATGEFVQEVELQQLDRHLDALAERTSFDPVQRWYRDARARQRWYHAVQITAAQRATRPSLAAAG